MLRVLLVRISVFDREAMQRDRTRGRTGTGTAGYALVNTIARGEKKAFGTAPQLAGRVSRGGGTGSTAQARPGNLSAGTAEDRVGSTTVAGGCPRLSAIRTRHFGRIPSSKPLDHILGNKFPLFTT